MSVYIYDGNAYDDTNSLAWDVAHDNFLIVCPEQFYAWMDANFTVRSLFDVLNTWDDKELVFDNIADSFADYIIHNHSEEIIVEGLRTGIIHEEESE